MKHLFIINPAAGKHDRSEEFSATIEKACKERGLDFSIMCSEAPGDCTIFAKQAAESGEEVRIYACGGDGTLNEVINGVAGFGNASVAHYPCGSGNDTIKMFSDPSQFFELERLLDGTESTMDMIRCNDVYSLNILSLGLDARVGTEAVRYKHIPLLSGHASYVVSLIVNLFKGLSQHMRISIDNKEVFDEKVTLVCICNGRWYGGGFYPVPNAEPDDGMLDVLIVKKVNIFQAFGVISMYKKGRYAELPNLIIHRRCRSLEILCDTESVVNVDGEAAYTRKAKIEILPKSVRFVHPAGLDYHFQNEAFRQNTAENNS